MNDPATTLLRAVARALADDRRVLLAAEPFDTLQQMAEARVKELVLVDESIDEGMPAGETTNGAPLRMRPDYKERPNSKDLVVDAQGLIPPAEATRLLKKAGFYLTCTPGETLRALPHHLTLSPRAIQGWLTEVEGGRAQVHLSTEGGQTLLSGIVEPEDDAPTLYIGSLSDQVPYPLAVLIEGQSAQADPEVASRLEAAEAEVAELKAALETAERRAEEASAAAEALQAEQTAREASRAEMMEAVKTAEADAEAARSELAERRVQDKRADLARAHFDAARSEMQAELEGLRGRLREVESPAADRAELETERDAARAAWSALATQIHAATTRLAKAAGRGRRANPEPPPGASDSGLLAAWAEGLDGRLAAIAEALEIRVSEITPLKRSLTTARRRAREQAEALAQANTSTKAAQATGSPAAEALSMTALTSADAERIQALEQALDAERAHRALLSDQVTGLRRAAQAALADRDRLVQALTEARRGAGLARLGQAAAEETTRRQTAALDLQAAQLGDLEAMVDEYQRMLALVSEALEQAEKTRDHARSEMQATAENLRLLQQEFERARAIQTAG